MTSCFLSVWLKVLVPLLDKMRPLFALQRQLFIVHSSDGRGQRSMTALLCFSWLGWACSQDLRPCKAGWTSVWFCYLHTSTHKHAAFYWCAHSSLLSFGQKQWPQRIHINLVQRSSVYCFERDLLELSFCRKCGNRVGCWNTAQCSNVNPDMAINTFMFMPFWLFLSVGKETLVSKHNASI